MQTSLPARGRLTRGCAALLVAATATLGLTLVPAGPAGGAPGAERNLSGTVDDRTDNAKLDGLQFYVPARDSDGNPVEVAYFDADGNQLGTRDRTKPQVALFADAIPGTGAQDVVAAYSRDDGETWASTDLSFGAARSSFTVYEGTERAAPYPGKITKPSLHSKGAYVFAAWTSAYCDTGFPRYEAEPENDLHGVGGAQRSTDYAALGHPDVGEMPYMCVWAARGVVDQSVDDEGQPTATHGDITWYQPERLTSGARYAVQLAIASAQGGGFALSWAEDPAGLRPGEGDGPGGGWTGSNTNYQSDIWYSFVRWSDFPTVATEPVVEDVPDQIAARPQPAVRMSMPVRISDNEALTPSTTTPYAAALCDRGFEDYDVQTGMTRVFCVDDGGEGTADDRLFDGDTAATRPFLFLTPAGGQDKAWAVIGYEESKGLGRQFGRDGEDHEEEHEPGGPGTPPCGSIGKNIQYVTFEMKSPVTAAAGDTMNPQLTDPDTGEPLWVIDGLTGDPDTDWKGDPIAARENARRARFIVQPRAQLGPSRTIMLAMYRTGTASHSGAADLFGHRFVVPDEPATENPYRFSNMEPQPMNLGAVTATAMWTDPATGRSKPTRWVQTPANLADGSQALPMDGARAHRGFLKGDLLFVGYLWTPSWEDMLAGKDVENYYVRRSFDGGATWTTTPASWGGTGNVVSCPSGNDPATGQRWTGPCTVLGAGEFEPARNLSRMDGFDDTVIEPRLVGLPGSIKPPPWDAATAYAEDTQSTRNVWQVWGTGANAPEPGLDDTEDEGKQPLDIFYAASRDYGDHYSTPAALASGAPAQGEAQVRFTPDGSRMRGVWNQSVVAGSDPAGIALDAFWREVALPQAGPDPVQEPAVTMPVLPAPGEAPAVTGVSRLAGGDRYRTAAETSAAFFPDGATTVVVATGEGFADALAAGPVARQLEAPILLAARDDLPLVTVTELQRLGAARVVVVGGTNALSDRVLTQLREQVATVERIAGADRYATAALLSARHFGAGPARVYVASGDAFADALAAGAAAAHHGVPILLTRATGMPDAVQAELARLAPDDVRLVGGTQAVGDQVGDQIRLRLRDRDRLQIHRIAGEDRFQTASMLAADAFPTPTGTVLVATGANFPDALAGSALGHPILLVTRDAADSDTVLQIRRLGTTETVVLGGSSAVADTVLRQIAGF